MTLAELTSRFPRQGFVDSILLRPARRETMLSVERAYLRDDGLDGDHARPGKRALTLIQAEHLPVLAALTGLEDIPAEVLRRNLVVAKLNLSACRGRRLQIGKDAIVEITGPCAPCSRMEAALGEGGYNAMRGHGGWCASVISPGEIALQDPVKVLSLDPDPSRG